MRDEIPEWRGRRPAGLDDATVEAMGKLSCALEKVERARGHLYAFHQLTGSAHADLEEVIEGLRAAGHRSQADALSTELLGRDVLAGRWTFQVVEEYDDGYYRCFVDLERRIRDELAEGRRHVFESEMKERHQK
ncbi:hypothetical protein [Nonomuraea lactucae]|uniref:hypothetical protein n=1 Tax=Nonomuraea lactucae TaxID=2249762 RepID=UPI000DE4CB90|nr:hypothetical protein [Nonomuraea lactucae]